MVDRQLIKDAYALRMAFGNIWSELENDENLKKSYGRLSLPPYADAEYSLLEAADCILNELVFCHFQIDSDDPLFDDLATEWERTDLDINRFIDKWEQYSKWVKGFQIHK